MWGVVARAAVSTAGTSAVTFNVHLRHRVSETTSCDPRGFVRTVATPLAFEADLLVVDESRRALDGVSLLSSPLPDSPLAQAEELPPEFLSYFEPGLML